METSRIQMPLLATGQSQKELTHNEALLLLDSIVHGCCSGAPANTAPAQPADGMGYICGPAPSGDWTGHAGAVAFWTVGGWRFVPAFEGLELTDRIDGTKWRFINGQWSAGVIDAREVRISGMKVLGSRRTGITAPSGGSIIDVEGRAVINEVLAAMRAHGLIAPQ